MPSVANTAPINPMLTNFQVGYKNRKEGFTAEFIAPPIKTNGLQTGTYQVWDKGDHFQNPDLKRAVRTKSKEIDYESTPATFSTNEFAVRHGWDTTEARRALAPVNLATKSAKIIADTIMLNYQREIDALITTGNIAQNVTLSGTDQWSDDSSNPPGDIVTGIRTIELATGVKPNRMVVGGQVWWDGLQNNPEIVARVQSTQKLAGLTTITPALVGQVFGLDLRVASAIYNTTKEGQTVSLAYSLGKLALLFYSDPNADESTPHFMSTFMAQNIQARRYFTQEDKTNWIDSSMDRDSVIIDATCAYLIDAVIA